VKKESIGFQRAARMAAEIVVNIPGQRLPAEVLYEQAYSLLPGFSVHFDRGWALAATIHVRFKRQEDPESARLIPEVSLSWSSSQRSVHHALAAVALYEDVVKAAALIECTLEREIILDKVEPPPPEPVAEVVTSSTTANECLTGGYHGT
jgi:hypothetical protein